MAVFEVIAKCRRHDDRWLCSYLINEPHITKQSNFTKINNNGHALLKGIPDLVTTVLLLDELQGRMQFFMSQTQSIFYLFLLLLVSSCVM